MISSVKTQNFRGSSAQHELGAKTLVVGPNGSGKSTIPAAIQYAAWGRIEGYKVNEAFENASSNEMLAEFRRDGHVVKRTKMQGKTLSEEIEIDGVSAKKNAADGMLRLALGTNPVVMDMDAFFSKSASLQREEIIACMCDLERYKDVAKRKEQAAALVNSLRADEQAARKAVASITTTTASVVGDLDTKRSERDVAQQQIQVVQKRIADGEANERFRVSAGDLDGRMKVTMDQVQDLARQEEDARQLVKAVEAQIENLPERPTVDPTLDLPDQVLTVIITATADLLLVLNTHENERLRSVIESLDALAPDKDTEVAQGLALSQWKATEKALRLELNKADSTLSTIVNQLKLKNGEASRILEDTKKLQDLGAGLDPNDKAMLAGLTEQLSALNIVVEQLSEADGVAREAEKARLNADAASEKLTEAKGKRAEVIAEEVAMLTEVLDILSERSTAVLPEGHLAIQTNDKAMDIVWIRPDSVVSRNTLSGAEQHLFDAALGYALSPDATIVLEAAELDEANLEASLARLSGLEPQVLVMTCHEPGILPDGWHLIDTGVDTVG